MANPGGPAKPASAGRVLTLHIEDLAFGGRGVARSGGMVIFVAGALPGETVRARVTRRRASYAEAVPIAILGASPERVVPPCEHYGVCGGCDLQHLEIAAQRRAKQSQVAALMARLGGLHDLVVEETATAGEPWAYRFRMDFDWVPGRGGEPSPGLHRRGSAEGIVPIRRCRLMSDRANAILRHLAAGASARRIPAWDRLKRRGFLRRVSIQEAGSTGEILLTLDTGLGDPPVLLDLVAELLRKFPRVVGVMRRSIDRGGRLVETSILSGRGHLCEEIGGDSFRVPAEAFFQPNTMAGALLRNLALAALAPGRGAAILELFSGVGFLTLPLARLVAQVTAVEGSPAAVEAARDNAARAGITNARFVHGEVAALLPGLLEERSWDGLILDPPRVGLPRGAAERIAAADLPRVVYVSCDPATLARDLGTLVRGGGLVVERVWPVDLFPQTHHIECVALLRRA